MSTTATVSTVIGSVVGGGLGYLWPQDLTPGQNWTVLTLFGALVFGVGARMVLALDRNTNATNEQAKSFAALANELRNATSQHEAEARDMREALQDLPDRIAERLKP